MKMCRILGKSQYILTKQNQGLADKTQHNMPQNDKNITNFIFPSESKCDKNNVFIDWAAVFIHFTLIFWKNEIGIKD